MGEEESRAFSKATFTYNTDFPVIKIMSKVYENEVFITLIKEIAS